MIDFLQVSEGALTAACVYILIGFGWNLVYNACGYLNLAIGEFYILGAILAVNLDTDWGIHSVLLRGLITIAAIGLLGFLCEIVLLRPVGTDALKALVITLGLALVLLQLAQQLSPEVVIHPEPFLSGPSLDVGGVLIAPQDLIVWGTCLVVTVGLIYFFWRTDLGRRMRAAVDSPPAAKMLGIRVKWYMTGAFAAGAVLAALAAFVVAPTQGVNYLQGDIIAIKSFMAVAIGGLGRYGGGVAGAFVVAFGEAYLARYWDPGAQQIVILAGFLVVLYVQAVRSTGGWRLPRLLRRRRLSTQPDAAA